MQNVQNSGNRKNPEAGTGAEVKSIELLELSNL
jgi:hypothetical protein